MLRLHVWNLTSRHVTGESHWAGSIYNLVAAAAGILKRVEVLANLAVVSIRIDRLVFVEARNRSHRLRLHRVLRLRKVRVLRMMVFMAIHDDGWHSIVLMIMAHVDVWSRRPLRMIMMISSTVEHNESLMNDSPFSVALARLSLQFKVHTHLNWEFFVLTNVMQITRGNFGATKH